MTITLATPMDDLGCIPQAIGSGPCILPRTLDLPACTSPSINGSRLEPSIGRKESGASALEESATVQESASSCAPFSTGHTETVVSSFSDNKHFLSRRAESIHGLPVLSGIIAAVTAGFLVAAHAESQPDYAELLVKQTFVLHANASSGTLDVSLNPTSQLNDSPSNIVWAIWLWGVSFLLSLSIAVLSTVAQKWLSRYGRASSKTPGVVPMHTRILVTFVVPILEPVLYLSVLLLVGGLAAYLSTMDRVLGIFVLVVLALSCLGWVLLKAIALRHHRRRRHRRSDRERGRRPHTSKSLPLPRSGQSRESESHSSDSSDQGGEGPSGGEPGHRRMRANHRQATALVSDNDRGHEQHWLNAYWRDIQPVSVRSLDMLLAAAALLSALIITLIIMDTRSPSDISGLTFARFWTPRLDEIPAIDLTHSSWLNAILDEIWVENPTIISLPNRLSHGGLLAAISGGLVALVGRQSLADCVSETAIRRSSRSYMHRTTGSPIQAFIFTSTSLLQIAVCLLLSSIAARSGTSTPLVKYAALICFAASSLATSIIALRLGYVLVQTFVRHPRPPVDSAVQTANRSRLHWPGRTELPNPPATTINSSRSLGYSWRDVLYLFSKTLLAMCSIVLFLVWLIPVAACDFSISSSPISPAHQCIVGLRLPQAFTDGGYYNSIPQTVAGAMATLSVVAVDIGLFVYGLVIYGVLLAVSSIFRTARANEQTEVSMRMRAQVEGQMQGEAREREKAQLQQHHQHHQQYHHHQYHQQQQLVRVQQPIRETELAQEREQRLMHSRARAEFRMQQNAQEREHLRVQEMEQLRVQEKELRIQQALEWKQVRMRQLERDKARTLVREKELVQAENQMNDQSRTYVTHPDPIAKLEKPPTLKEC